MERCDYLKSPMNYYELDLLQDKEKWDKSFTSVSKQNLNSEVKEKESVSKTFINGDRRKIMSRHSYHKKPRDFIDNRLNPDSLGMSIKNTNEGCGRGAALQRRTENLHPNGFPEQFLHDYLSHHDNLFSAPIRHQMKEVVGDRYSDAALRRSLNDFSKRSSLTDEGSTSSSSCGLERALSDISLTTSSRSDAQSSLKGAEAFPASEWVPKDSLLDPLQAEYDLNFPKL